MIKKFKDIKIFGLIFAIVATLFVIGLSAPFFIEERLQPYLYNAGGRADLRGTVLRMYEAGRKQNKVL